MDTPADHPAGHPAAHLASPQRPSNVRRRRLGAALAVALWAGGTIASTAPAGAVAAATPTIVVFDDMEHGDPPANGWFTFGSATGGGGIDPNSADLPPTDGGGLSLQTGWGGAPGFYGGFGRGNPIDISGMQYFNFWINPDAGQSYTLEFNLQDDATGSGTPDDEFQFNCVVSVSGPCAGSGRGWQRVSIPLVDFVDDNSFLSGGNGSLDDRIVNAVVAVIGDGGTVTFRTDFWAFSDLPLAEPRTLIDDFESGVGPGTACPPAAPPINFCTFAGPGSSVAISNAATPPAPPLPAAGTPNSVLQMDIDASSYAGFIRGFQSGGQWVGQDWSKSEGLALWFHGTGSGTGLFIDVLDNRNPGSTIDDAERWTVSFTDDVAGWRELKFPFSSFTRKEIGNSAPNDGFTLFDVHGWALGTLGTGGARTYYVDQVSRYGIGQPPALAVNLARQNTLVEEGTTGQIAVKLNRPMGPDDPAQVSIDFATERSYATPGEEFTSTRGTLTFVNGGPSELSFPVETFEDTKFEGDEQIVIRLTNPVGAERGALFQGSVLIDDDDPFDPNLLDEFEQGAYLWDAAGPVALAAVRSESGDSAARPGQDAFENVLQAVVPRSVAIVVSGPVCKPRNGVVPVSLLSTPDFDATTVDHTTVTFGAATEAHVNRKSGQPERHVEDVNRDGRRDLVFHFRSQDIGAGCDPAVIPFNGFTAAGQPITAGGSDAGFGRDFALGQDWSNAESISFWYEGSGGGEDVTLTLKDNRAPETGPAGWDLVWSDEFNGPAGTPPSDDNWVHEIGDTTPDGKNGWGNEEFQYYTDDPANAATDGNGNLAITLREADGSQECYYGPCRYTSARLLTQNRAEFAYGRVESRLRIPGELAGQDLRGLWPAFWSLGTDITRNPWPGAGEIDIMEWVGRLPDEIFGTVHGPGYSGGASIGDLYDFGQPAYLAGADGGFHTFSVEWQPDLIVWYVDGVEYHRVTPADLPGPWVFDKPFFLLLNFAIGGNFGGPVGDGVTFPQEYLVDYVRVYQGPDTAERFEASFTDDIAGWRQVTIPIADFVRSADQPAGAPDDGLGLDEVWGYGFALPDGNASGALRLDQVHIVPVPPPTAITVTNLNDDGDGSLRRALDDIADVGGTITFDPALAGQTLTLTTGPLVVDKSVTIDGAGAPGIAVDGGGTDRVLIVEAGGDATVRHLTLRNGSGFQLAGCVLNNASLTLERSTVTGCRMTTNAGEFWQGGGGVYNGDGATFTMLDSTVSDNHADWSGGGVYSFFNTTTVIERSTLSGNVSGDVGGAFRSLGEATILNSTISGNRSLGWHGGAIFQTDGDVDISNSTIAGNVGPDWAPSALFVGQFGGSSVPTLTLTNTIITGNQWYACERFASPIAGNIVSGGHNLIQDGSCNPGADDLIVGDAAIGPLADNGGPTRTHALLASSPAIDAADATACPAVDQRRVSRPQGAGCDVGAYERM